MVKKIFTIDLQIAAVLLGLACEDQIVTGLDLEVFSLILVLERQTKTGKHFGKVRLESKLVLKLQ